MVWVRFFSFDEISNKHCYKCYIVYIEFEYTFFLWCRYGDFSGGYGGGYGNQGFSGNFQLGAKRKSDLGDFGGSPKKPFGTQRGNATIWNCVNPISVDSISFYPSSGFLHIYNIFSVTNDTLFNLGYFSCSLWAVLIALTPLRTWMFFSLFYRTR